MRPLTADAATAIALTTKRLTDGLYTVLGTIGAAIALATALHGVTPADLEGAKYEGLFQLYYQLVGPLGVRATFALFGLYLAFLVLGAGWRLWDGRPALAASPELLEFHPSLYPRPLAWGRVRRVWVSHRPGRLNVELDHRYWSPAAWLSSKQIRISLAALDLSTGEGQKLARALRYLARPAGAPAGRRAPRSFPAVRTNAERCARVRRRHPVDRRRLARPLLAAAASIGCLGAFFLWGETFELFGHRIDVAGRPVATLGFLAWLPLAVYFAALAVSKPSKAATRAGIVFALLLIAALVGLALKH